MLADIRDVVEELGQGLDALVANVVELAHKLLLQLVVNGRHGKRRGLVLQEVPVRRRGQVQLQIWPIHITNSMSQGRYNCKGQ